MGVKVKLLSSYYHSVRLKMDPYIWVPRTVVAVAYPLYSSLEAVLTENVEAALDWLKYWMVFGVFSILELIFDPLIDQMPFSSPYYLILKCCFLTWCMVPADWNGTLIIFDKIIYPLYRMHQDDFEGRAEIAKVNIKDKLEMILRRDKFELKRL